MTDWVFCVFFHQFASLLHRQESSALCLKRKKYSGLTGLWQADPCAICPKYRMQEHCIDIQPGVLFICDMRSGFSEGGVGLKMPGGRYILTMIEVGSLQGFQLMLEGKRADKRKKFQELSLDGTCIGVYDKNRILEHFGHDFESIYEWSADRSSADQIWEDISDENAGLAFYVKTFADCNCELIKLYSNNTVVGFGLFQFWTSPEESKKDPGPGSHSNARDSIKSLIFAMTETTILNSMKLSMMFCQIYVLSKLKQGWIFLMKNV